MYNVEIQNKKKRANMYNVEIQNKGYSKRGVLFCSEKEDANMDIIKVKADKDGRYFVTLYGNKIELVPVKEEPKPVTKPAKTEK